MRVTSINPDKFNPRKITDRDFRALKLSIMRYGFVEPVVVQKTGLRLVGGHQRLRALKEIAQEHGLRLTYIPAVVVDVDDRKARQLNVALNKISGDWDEEILTRVFREMEQEQPMLDEELDATGFSRTEFEEYTIDPAKLPESGMAPSSRGAPPCRWSSIPSPSATS